jgi:hypothetical protein
MSPTPICDIALSWRGKQARRFPATSHDVAVRRGWYFETLQFQQRCHDQHGARRVSIGRHFDLSFEGRAM